MYVVEALMDLCKEQCQPVAEDLFVISFTVYAMPVDDQIQIMALCKYIIFLLILYQVISIVKSK